MPTSHTSHTSLALSNLKYGKWRTAISTSGVAVAIILIFMQLGFLNAVAATATLIYDHLEFDALIRSPDYYHFCDPREFPRDYLYRVAAHPDVLDVKPLHVTLATWRIPDNPRTRQQQTAGELRAILAMAIEPTENVFDLAAVDAQLDRLKNPRNLLIDTKTPGDDYGALNGDEFTMLDLQRNADLEIWDKSFHAVGYFTLGAGLAANGSVIMSRAGYARFFPTDTTEQVNYGLVSLAPGTDPPTFCHEMTTQLAMPAPRDERSGARATPVKILTRDEVARYERHRWLFQTPIGAIFLIGVAVALVVGGVVVYMVLSTDVANHLHEYATLKAMGYTDRYLSGVVMQQAVAMGVLGYLMAWALAELLYRIVGRLANIPMEMNWALRLLVFGLSLLMCCVSGLATLRKLRGADPADLF